MYILKTITLRFLRVMRCLVSTRRCKYICSLISLLILVHLVLYFYKAKTPVFVQQTYVYHHTDPPMSPQESKSLSLLIACYESVVKDALPSVEDINFSAGRRPIFFLETSCRGGIQAREACAVESATRLHPNRQINLLFISSVRKQQLRFNALGRLRKFKNLKFARIHYKLIGKHTKVESVLSQRLNYSMFPAEHAADILKIVTLHKFGGVYLDTDMIVVQNLDSLPDNWIAQESYEDVASSALAFTKNGIGASVLRSVLEDIEITYNPFTLVNSPKPLQRALKKICPNNINTTGDCGGVEILPFQLFYPVHYSQNRPIFENGTIVDADTEKPPYMYHMWNYLSSNIPIEKDSLYDKLAETFCPTIHKMYGNFLGYNKVLKRITKP